MKMSRPRGRQEGKSTKSQRVDLKSSQAEAIVDAHSRFIAGRTRSQRALILRQAAKAAAQELAEPRESRAVKFHYEVNEEGVIRLLSLKGRAPTHLPGAQGDHISAYRLMQEIIYSQLNDATPEEAIGRMVNILFSFEAIARSGQDVNFAAAFHQMMANLQDEPGYISCERLPLALQEVEDSDLSARAKAAKKQEIISTQLEFYTQIALHLSAMFITERNKQAHTACPIDESTSPPPGEGNRVKKAIRNLRAMHQKMEKAYQQGEELVLSEQEIDEIAENMYQLFWYPRTPDRRQHPDVLHQVLANHIQLFFLGYPQFHGKQQNDIIEAFVKQVTSTGQIKGIAYNWVMRDKAFRRCLENVKKLLPNYYAELDQAYFTSDAKGHHVRSAQPSADYIRFKESLASGREYPQADKLRDPDFKLNEADVAMEEAEDLHDEADCCSHIQLGK